MAITLSKYIYPLEKEIVLSKHFGYVIDNPRTAEEIEFIKGYISPALKRNYESHKPNYNPMLSMAFGISKLREFTKVSNQYVHDYLTKMYQAEIDDIISESWIIIRYSDNGEFEKAKADRGAFFDIFYTDARDAYWEKYHNLLGYFQVVSLLIHSDQSVYPGDSMVLLKKPQDIFYPIENYHNIIEAFKHFSGNCSVCGPNRGRTWDFYPDAEENIISVANLMENFFLTEGNKDENRKKKKQSGKEKLLFIGDILRIIENETQDVKVKLLLLVSIVEYLVTRNPDTNRFNIEDSINKQFVLKASVVIYQNNRGRKLEELSINLKRIYKQRSDVAHGNHISIAEEKSMLGSFYQLYEYIRAIVEEFVKDPNLINYLKEA